ncbi:MAG: hypothetical protein JJE22_00810 [Bacteroidia bacterium]|nr:hypothetical protein [Bacteroidia bacterium]
MYFILRTFLLAGSALCIFWSVIKIVDYKKKIDYLFTPLNFKITIFILILSVAILVTFLVSPNIFSRFTLEDGPIEWGTYFCFLGAAIIFFIILLSIKKFNNNQHLKIICLLLFLFFFISSMEEVSWFQRTLNIETPQLFEQNEQHELNFHNFHTNFFEVLFYFFSFFFLIVCPFLKYMGYFENQPIFNFFVPNLETALIAVAFVPYNFDMWNIPTSQISVFFSIFFLLYFYKKQKTIALLLIYIIIAQVIYLSINRYQRSWEITEYKEFFISLTFFYYSLNVFLQFKRNNLVLL